MAQITEKKGGTNCCELFALDNQAVILLFFAENDRHAVVINSVFVNPQRTCSGAKRTSRFCLAVAGPDIFASWLRERMTFMPKYLCLSVRA